VRQYGLSQLSESQEEAATRERHLIWFAQRFEEIIAAWNSADQATLLRKVDVDLENIRSALAWGLGPGAAAIPVLRLASALSRYWTTRGLVSEGRRWTAGALDAAVHAPAPLRATALNRCAILARMEGDANATRELWDASLALFRAMGDDEGVARVVGNLGLLCYDQGDDEGAVAALTESIALKRQQDNLQEVAISLLNLGMVHTRLKRYADGEAAFAEAGEIWRAAGDKAGMSLACLNTAHLARDQQQFDRAASLYAATLRISQALGDRPQVPTALEGMAHVLLHRHEGGTIERTTPKLCARLFACAAALRESTGVSIHAANQPIYKADLQRLQKLLGAGRFEAEWSTGWNTPVASIVEQVPTPA
jgi:tetratricopeptide (TPR) repeat protein